jgi:hypothetical protein
MAKKQPIANWTGYQNTVRLLSSTILCLVFKVFSGIWFLVVNCIFLNNLTIFWQASKTTTAFLHQVLERVQSTSHLKMETRIAVLERARIDLQRLGSIEPRLSDPSAFAEIYIHCQSLILKCLASKFLSIFLDFRDENISWDSPKLCHYFFILP